MPVPSTVSKRPLSAVSADVRLAISPASTESFVASTELTSATTSANVSVSAVDADRIASIRDFCTSEYAVYAVVINVSRASVYAAAVVSAADCAVDNSFRSASSTPLTVTGTVNAAAVLLRAKRCIPSTVIPTVPVPRSAISISVSPSVIAAVEIAPTSWSTYSFVTACPSAVGEPTLIS